MSDENRLDVAPKRPEETMFRDDLREPTISWGRCTITGEWGPVVGLDLGDISVESPVVEKGVIYDPLTGDVTFTNWKPILFEQSLTVSRAGLEKLLHWMDDQELPVPTITPVLLYKWVVMYSDGSVVSQFEVDPETSLEHENSSRLIDFSRISQVSVCPREAGSELPTYTYDWATNTTYKNGVPIDTEYEGERHADATAFCQRKVTHTWGSVMGDGLERVIQNAHTTVLYLLGWYTYENGPCCIISVDERGNWRPWNYN